MEKYEMSQNVIFLALCVFALIDCGSSANINTNKIFVQNSISAFSPHVTRSSEILSSELSRFKREHVQADEDETTRRTFGIDYFDSDSDSDSGLDDQIITNPPDISYEINPTIINGTRVDQPIRYQLSIRFQKQPPFGPWEHICGAVILDQTTAITAAHCFGNSKDVRRYRLTAGENQLNVTEETEQVLQIQKLIIHAEFTDVSNGNDIAILHLDKIQFNEHVRGVWLSPFPTQKLSNLTAVISGWGVVSLPGQLSNSLQKGSLSILSPQNCQARLKRLKVAATGILCGLNTDTRACSGDSGGPLVIQNYKLPSGNAMGNLLVGIISFGAGTKCNIRNTTSFTTEISCFYDWIQENRAENPCAEKHSCVSGGGCFHSDLKCNGKEDCADGTDEIECSEHKIKIKIQTTTTTTTEKTTTTKTTTTKTPVITPSTPRLKSSSISSCSDAMETLQSPRSAKQTIYPHGNSTKVEVLCDFETDGGGWTIIQKRANGLRDEFNRKWKLYVNGFGLFDKNFWLGLENIRTLTKNGDQELRIDLEDFEGEKRYAKYSSFSISDATDFYRLTISGFDKNSTAGDSMTRSVNSPNHGMRFSTRDKDNDNSTGNCAAYFSAGGWWWNVCGESRLNGLYFEKGQAVPFAQGINWYSWEDDYFSLAKTEMKIRTRRSESESESISKSA